MQHYLFDEHFFNVQDKRTWEKLLQNQCKITAITDAMPPPSDVNVQNLIFVYRSHKVHHCVMQSAWTEM